MHGLSSRLSALAVGGFLMSLVSGCALLRPGVVGAPTSSPALPWVPPSEARAPVRSPSSGELVPPEIQGRKWGLEDVVNLSLRNNADTRAAWARARAAVEEYGILMAELEPSLTLSADARSVGARKTDEVGTTRRFSVGPSVNLSWLLLDAGGRAASVEGARQSFWAAGWTQNAAIQDAVLATERAYYQYLAAKAALQARRASLQDAQIHLDAATGRHRAGVATIADVLQARTVVAQATLNLQSIEGQLQTTRGVLANAMGLPANTSFDVEDLPAEVPVTEVGRQVDELIRDALGNRADLAAARAQALASESEVAKARSAGLPTLSLSGSLGSAYINQRTPALGSVESREDQLVAGLVLEWPLYTGGAVAHRVQKSRALAEAARESARALEQDVILQVFTSYHAVRTAAQKVRTSEELLASATQSLNVAEGRYREGVGTTVDVVTAQSALADARAQNVQARWDWYTSLAQLAHDAGLLEPTGKNPLSSALSAAPNGLPQEK